LWGAALLDASTARILQLAPHNRYNHIQQNQNNTPNGVTGPLFS